MYPVSLPEPNLLSHTAHSVSKKGVKRRDLNDKELGQMLSDLLPLIRVDHVLPAHSEVLVSAVKRGLLAGPLAVSLGSEDALLHRMAAWTGRTNSGAFLKPRLFMPYYEEAKVRVTSANEEKVFCLQACKCAGISGNFARASPHTQEAMIIIIIVIAVFGMHENMNGT